jgi:hypothetical protein
MLLMQPRWLLHIEGATLFAAAILAYSYLNGNWWLFAVLLLAPDVFALGYLINVHIGSALYNLVHIELFPAILIIAGVLAVNHTFALLGCIWLAHIGMDRMLGFGLKYPTRFQDTHLQHV